MTKCITITSGVFNSDHITSDGNSSEDIPAFSLEIGAKDFLNTNVLNPENT